MTIRRSISFEAEEREQALRRGTPAGQTGDRRKPVLASAARVDDQSLRIPTRQDA